MTVVDCPCGATYRVDPALGRRRFRCRRCAAVLTAGGRAWTGPVLLGLAVAASMLGVAVIQRTAEETDAAAQASASAGAAASPTLAPATEPPCTPLERRPMTGQVMFRAAGEGNGDLSIENAMSADAIVMMIALPPAAPYRVVYVRAGGTAEVRQLQAGDYWLQFQSGTGFTGRGFCQVAGTTQFDDRLRFEERPAASGVEVTSISVRLYLPVTIGAGASPLPEALFRLPPLDVQ